MCMITSISASLSRTFLIVSFAKKLREFYFRKTIYVSSLVVSNFIVTHINILYLLWQNRVEVYLTDLEKQTWIIKITRANLRRKYSRKFPKTTINFF